jgi:hypothetical protein
MIPVFSRALTMSPNQKTGLSLVGLFAVFIFGMVCIVLL